MTAPADTPGEVAVYDLRGRRVAAVTAGTIPSGEHNLTWDGRDTSGRCCPAGVYLLRLETEVGSTSQSFALLR